VVPATLSRKLSQLRRRETLLRLIWGAARWFALVLGLLLLACLIDWSLDRDEDTPWAVRVALTAVQAVVMLAAAWRFLIKPLLRRPNDSDLALWVEDQNPRLGHRLISAVQLNQPDADTAGMSRELIDRVTAEAEQEANRIPFASLADHRRVKWSGLVAGPILLVALACLLLWPALALSLLARQLLADVQIPRSVTIASLTQEVWPNGEKVVLRFQAKGKDLDKAIGDVLIQPAGAPSDRYALVLRQHDGDEAIFETDMPAMSSDFAYRAWLGDGRLPRTQRVRFVPRPVVLNIEGWSMLPAYCGVKPDGGRYERVQPRGEITGISGSTARLLIQVQKPVITAALELLGPADDADKKDEPIRRRIALALDRAGLHAHGEFDLHPDEAVYRVIVTDEHGFANVPPPRRGLKIIPEDPPQIALLREQALFPPKLQLTGDTSTEEVDLEGMPVPIGRPIRIGFNCTGPYGLDHAQLLYRLLQKSESGDEPEEKWQTLPLVEVKAPEDAGPFLPQFGVFQKSGPRDQVPFHAVPSPDPEHVLGRRLGGGRFNFQTSGLIDAKGQRLKLKEGDQIEYCVEVYAGRDGKTRPFARSETRVKTIVSVEEFARWRYELSQEQERLSKLEAKQGGVFAPPK